MKRRELNKLEAKLDEYMRSLFDGMGREERRRALGWYLTGLLLDGDRKSIDPLAARLAESDAERGAMRQRLQQAVCVASWSDDELYRRLAVRFERELPELEALVIDDTGFPKKGTHSVGVARQYSGTLGRTDNCQVAVSLHLAGAKGSGCIGFRLFLPDEWTQDPARCRSAGVPEEIVFEKKWKLALGLIDRALAFGVRKHLVLADAGYGDARDFRDALTERGLAYLVAIQGSHSVWPPGSNPQLPARVAGQNGRPRTRYQDENVQPLAIEQLSQTLKYEKVTWREGSKGTQSSRFAATRVRMAEGRMHGKPPSEELWLLCEWPKDEEKPTKFYVSTLPSTTTLKELARRAKLRWRVERDYQEMKQEVGLDHFEGRSWRGFHHHVALCAAAHGFLALRRALFPPEQTSVVSA